MKQFVEPESLRGFRLFLLAAIILGSIAGNIIVIKSVMLAKLIKSVTYIVISNLALAEIVSACCLPFLQSYAELHTWPFPEWVCHLVSPVKMTAEMVVATCIASMVVVRYLFVRSLTFCRTRCSIIVAQLVMGVGMWIAAFLFFLPYFLYMHSMSDDGKVWCLLLLPGDKLDESYPSPRQIRYIIVQLIVNYVFPLTIALVCYAFVFKFIRSYNKVSVMSSISKSRYKPDMTEIEVTKMESESDSDAKDQQKDPDKTTTTSKTRSTQTRKLARDADRLKKYESDLLRMFYVIVLIFGLCNIPYQCFLVLQYMNCLSLKDWKYFDVTRSYLYLLACFPSFLHPLCYGLMSRFYHNAFKLLIGR